ncbi:MAG: sigma-70 family RNA polymerase sigma factor [Planctomycetota bacterium]
MDTETETASTTALRLARRLVMRWRDPITRAGADDLAQETAIEVWRRLATLRRRESLEGFVRTVCRRRRSRSLADQLRRSVESLDADEERARQIAAPRRGSPTLSVAGRAVPLDWCLGELDGALASLGVLNMQLLRSYYEGFSCRELAERYRLPERVVKVRLYRCRRRVRTVLERRSHACAAGAPLS